ncbi:uncharacterized membrane protein YobD (UPF0266 family) [Chryseobacterium ginsenosidimutans]|uniref:hypothetical protein n=1 Tax=Chryseobacterium ginsenosidimutans TaxID=687846 RepID=UPI00216732D7|nr:hypothetical protein [Chryseobacterium ginsenosidimutans]MCS3869334.1 uncharacterized membrane protein YobD (UPF0266 family) [Chryseobacterium ginsenosidimutans]
MKKKDSLQLTTVKFKKNKVGFTVAAIISLVLGGMFYFIFKDESIIIGWFLFAAGIILSIYCLSNATSHVVVLELNARGIKYKKYHYSWAELRSYSIREENHEDASFTYLVLNLKNIKTPLAIQLDWIDDQQSVKHHMAIFAEAFQIEFEE